MIYEIRYLGIVVKKDIPKLPKNDKERVKKAIEEKLTTDPVGFGKPLRRSLKNYRKLRVGNYRIVFRIDGLFVKIFAILHRFIVYEVMEYRI